MDAPYTLAFIDGTADVEFPSLRALAAYVVGHRNAQAPDAEGNPPEIAIREARLEGRGEIGGACVSIRMRLTRDGGPGALVGYAFLPGVKFITTRVLELVMTAILDAAAAAEARALQKAAA